jgi:hypothetical protein
MRSGWRSILLAVVAVLAIGCMSPTLPLPPPGPPSDSAGATVGTIHLHGNANSVQPNAIVLIVNNYPNASESLTNEQSVTATRANLDGSWDATVYAIKGDVLQILQLFGNNNESPSIDYTVTN